MAPTLEERGKRPHTHPHQHVIYKPQLRHLELWRVKAQVGEKKNKEMKRKQGHLWFHNSPLGGVLKCTASACAPVSSVHRDGTAVQPGHTLKASPLTAPPILHSQSISKSLHCLLDLPPLPASLHPPEGGRLLPGPWQWTLVSLCTCSPTAVAHTFQNKPHSDSAQLIPLGAPPR